MLWVERDAILVVFEDIILDRYLRQRKSVAETAPLCRNAVSHVAVSCARLDVDGSLGLRHVDELGQIGVHLLVEID